MPSLPVSIALAVAGVFVSLYLINRIFGPKHTKNEPYLIPQKVPYIGHVISVIRDGIWYYLGISAKTAFPIHTMHLLSSKVYVVNSIDLISLIQRNVPTLSFYPFMAAWLQQLLALDDPSMEILRTNMGSKVEKNFVCESDEIFHRLLSPGFSLNRLQNEIFQGTARSFNEDPFGRISTTVGAFVDKRFMEVNTLAMWGARNPFTLKPELAKSFWNVDDKFYLLLLNIFPKWTASGAAQDRDKLADAFREYYATGGSNTASELVSGRANIARSYGLNDDAMARLDMGLVHALLANAAPIATWMLLHIFSTPSLLAEIRMEVTKLLVRDETDPDILTIDFPRLRAECPVLVAVWNEVLRRTSHLPNGRKVTEDTLLQDKYLLKKDATLFIFSGVLHANEQEWGPDFAEFNPSRFLPGHNYRKPHPSAFRPFGGGTVLCPGRHLAFVEITTFVATFVLGYDVVPEKGGWPALVRDVTRPSLGVFKPTKASDAKVVISRRPEYLNTKWKFATQPVG